VVSPLATVALYDADHASLAWGLGLLSLAYHALVYALGGRLLDRLDDRRRTGAAESTS
jgi:hypothetical protein